MSNKRFAFGSKAENLEFLGGELTSCTVPKLLYFSAADWWQDEPKLLNRIRDTFAGGAVVVRSSAKNEDSSHASHAGEYLSLLHIDPEDIDHVRDAVEQVFGSYSRREPLDQVCVQQQVADVVMSGVIFTRDIETLAPYLTINFENSNSTDGITSGKSTNPRMHVRYRFAPSKEPSSQIASLVAMCEELFVVTTEDALDIEFAIDTHDTIHLLQVRPIVRRQDPLVSDEAIGPCLEKVKKKIEKLNGPHPGLHGTTAIYSIMTDWNPAEIIGVRPRPLALSLYKELITDSIWAYQRSNYGYKNLRGFPLLVSFLGCPYIDVRASFNSFIPAELDDALTEKLVNYYSERLLRAPSDHDKVEFKIVYSCYYLNLPSKLLVLKEVGFSDLELDRIKFALLNLTNRLVSARDGLYHEDENKIRTLEEKYQKIKDSNLGPIDKIYWMIEDCKRYGTLPFAGLARAGFVAIQFLRSFVELRIITESELNGYLQSLNTVNKRLVTDFKLYRAGALGKDVILEKYGHLRPGTYDILSPRYDEAFDVYFSHSTPHDETTDETAFTFSSEQRAAISTLLISHGLSISVDELLVFLKAAIEGREYSKFVFTRSLSYVLLLIEELGRKNLISKDDLSYVDIKTILQLYSSLTSASVEPMLREHIVGNKREYNVTRAVKLPELITSPMQVYSFTGGNVEANYITQKRVTDLVVCEDEFLELDLKGRIVMIRSADPGYDWIFSRCIGGLITMYGGANSHMAIRCAELQIPAVIGCGEALFQNLQSASRVEIDCAAKQVRKIV